MKAHTTYKIHPKAIEEFINDQYSLNSINFGNIEKNVKAILKKLNLDTILECEWDVNPLYFFDKIDISKSNNKPSDFDQYANFTFSFTSLIDKNSTKEYEYAIEKLETEFINKYQIRIAKEYKELKDAKEKKQRKKEKLAYIVSGVLLATLAAVVLMIKLSEN